MMTDTDIASMARLIDTDAQEIKSDAARALVSGMHATFAIERLNRARKLETIAASLRTLTDNRRSRSEVKSEVKLAAACACAADEVIQPIGRGGLSY
jgi:hypothetical protein